MEFSIIIFVSILAAAFVQTVTGFAFAIVIMSVWPLFMPVVEATQLMSFGSFTCILFILIRHRRHINYRISVVPVLLGLTGIVAGVTILVSLQNDIMIRIVGGILVILAVYLFFFADRARVKPNLLTASAAGAASGIMGGLFNISGPMMVLYYTAVARDKREYIGTLQFYFIIVIVVKFVILWVDRGLSPFVLKNAPIVVVASVLGMLLGFKLFDAIPGSLLKKLVLILMVVSGVWYIFR